MPHLRREIDRQIAQVLDASWRLESANFEEFMAIVNRLREEIILAIVQGGQIDVYTASMIKARLQQIMALYEQKFSDLMSESQRKMWVKGIQVVDKAVEAGDILRAVPYLDENTLRQAQQYSATLVKNLTGDSLQRVNAVMDLAVLGQKPVNDVVQEIGTNLSDAGVFGTVRRRAEIVYRTEVNRIHQMATVQRIMQLAKSIPDLRKEWLHSRTGEPRPGHLALDGVVIPAVENFVLKGSKSEYRVFGPFDPSLPAEETVNCRCRVVPFIGRYQKKRA